MSKKKEKQGGYPLIVIGLVLVAAVVLFAYCTNTKTTSGNRTPTPVTTVTPVKPVAQLGAQPPHFLGSPNASVTLEEFADFQCPSCGQVYPAMHEIQSMYGPRIKFIFREFPLPMHDKAYDASAAAEAAGLQGEDKFWAMQNLLYTNQRLWSVDQNYKQTLKDYASKIGLDVDRFETDMAGMQSKSRIEDDINRGKALNINSTPTLFINGKPVAFPDMNVPTLQKLIDEELKAAQVQQQPAQSSPAASNSNTSGPTKK